LLHAFEGTCHFIETAYAKPENLHTKNEVLVVAELYQYKIVRQIGVKIDIKKYWIMPNNNCRLTTKPLALRAAFRFWAVAPLS
jgi:hypothetical protein